MSNQYGDLLEENSLLASDIAGQQEATKSLISTTEELKSSFKKMIDEFKGYESVSETKEILKKLNKELKTLDKTTVKLVDEQNLNIETQAKIKDGAPMKDTSKMNDRQRKKYFNSLQEEREAQEEQQGILKERSGESQKSLKDSMKKIALAKARLYEVEGDDRSRFEKLKGEETPKSEPDPKEESEPDKGRKKSETEEDRKEEKKNKKFSAIFSKQVGGVMLGSFKTIMSPITIGFKSITGILSGLWNSHLASVAKVGAFIGLMIYSFDWVKVLIQNWKEQMQENYDEFKSKNSVWGGAMERLVTFSDTIRKFIDPSFESEFVASKEVKLMGIFKSAGLVIGETVKTILMSTMDGMLRLINNALPGTTKYTSDQWRVKNLIDRGTGIDNQDLNTSNAWDAKGARKSQQHTMYMKLTGGNIHNIKDVEHASNLNDTEYSQLKKGAIANLMVTEGKTKEEAYEMVDDIEVVNDFMLLLKKTFKEIRSVIPEEEMDDNTLIKTMKDYGKDDNAVKGRLNVGDNLALLFEKYMEDVGLVDVNKIEAEVNKHAYLNALKLGEDVSDFELSKIGKTREEFESDRYKAFIRDSISKKEEYVDSDGNNMNAEMSRNSNKSVILLGAINKTMTQLLEKEQNGGNVQINNQNINNTSSGTPSAELQYISADSIHSR